MPQLRRLVAGVSPQRLGFDPRSTLVRFVMRSDAETGLSPSTGTSVLLSVSVRQCFMLVDSLITNVI